MCIRALASLSFIRPAANEIMRQVWVNNILPTRVIVNWSFVGRNCWRNFSTCVEVEHSIRDSTKFFLLWANMRKHWSAIFTRLEVFTSYTGECNVSSTFDNAASLECMCDDYNRFMNEANQAIILQPNCNIVDALLKLLVISRSIIICHFLSHHDSRAKNIEPLSLWDIIIAAPPPRNNELSSGVNMLDAGMQESKVSYYLYYLHYFIVMDCMTGTLKLLINLTYNHSEAIERVRLCTVNNESGLAIILSLISTKISEKELFDLQQHVLGLLINLVCLKTN